MSSHGPVAINEGEVSDSQTWPRDAVGGVAAANFTNRLSVTLD